MRLSGTLRESHPEVDRCCTPCATRPRAPGLLPKVGVVMYVLQ
jgi:hypothetical protein